MAGRLAGAVKDVIVLGAGLAGLAAARRLSEGGLSVLVLDKGRRPGGRATTRTPRDGGVPLNHGLPALPPEARAMLPDLPATLHDEIDGLAAPLDLRTGATVEEVGGNAVIWRDAKGLVQEEKADRVLSTLPAPQVAALLPGAVPEDVVMAPRWTLMVRASGLDARLLSLPEGWVLGHALEGAAAIHMDVAESRSELEREKPEMAGIMAARLDLPAGAEIAAHRWRYAHPERPAGTPFLQHGPTLIGGDWCLGTGIGDGAVAALRSGLAMADRVLA